MLARTLGIAPLICPPIQMSQSRGLLNALSSYLGPFRIQNPFQNASPNRFRKRREVSCSVFEGPKSVGEIIGNHQLIDRIQPTP